MEQFNFSGLQKKYPILTTTDISFLNNFFNSDKIIQKFNELEILRKKFLRAELVAIIVVNIILTIIYFILKDTKNYVAIVGFVNVATMIIVGLFFKSVPKEIKENIIPELASNIDPNLKYDSGTKYSFDEGIFISNGIMNQYDRLDFKEDGIEYSYKYTGEKLSAKLDEETEESEEDKMLEENTEKKLDNNIKGGFLINGYEIMTSNKHTDKDGNTHYETSNHAYLLRIKFENAVHNIKEGITLKTDKNDNFKRKIVIVSFIYIFVIAFLFTPIIIFFDQVLKPYFNTIGVNIFAPIIVCYVLIYYIIFLIYNKIINLKRVKLENIEFEKKFDVYCKDQIESRKILTPDFMYKIVDYVNKINSSRVYEFHFIGGEIYIKRDLRMDGSFMEISIFKNLISNVEQLLQFYLELKSVTLLAQDLGLFYFDRTEMNTTVIK